MDDGGPPEMTIAIAESRTANDLNQIQRGASLKYLMRISVIS